MNQKEYVRLINRQRNLPGQLVRARLRVKQLEAEAARIGLRDILEKPSTIDAAWEREIELAKLGDVSEPAIDRNAA